jgi:hypothetical protein
MRMLLLFATFACTIELPDDKNCETRTAYYPDADGDGLGEPSTVYVGCEPPDDTWVTTPAPTPDEPDTGDSGSQDSGDSGGG